ncbi:colicin immunity domain-containing protein [Serratia entomophila]|uniref:Colicin immunity protein n=1 Tax=Serratia entomophila TaxID=42906 RepID=A0ABY5CXC8_9GAMM|nr:colicin immunity domain-containing protein [Serratia entomophila]UIW20289.1 colicin immunity protein [Serratia entomophila]USV02791.1 colicin immunity protein [Serratia entomophila]
MSMKLIEIARDLVSSKLTADDFELQFFTIWREESDSGQLAKDSQHVGECASELFILADCYTSQSNRRESELDADGLKKEVKDTLERFHLL